MEIDARSPEGNAFFIMAMVKKLLEKSGRGSKWPGVQLKMRSGDYDNLCKIAKEVTFGSVRVINRVNQEED